MTSILGGDPHNLGEIDGMNQLETILKGEPSEREELLINIDEVENHVGIIGYQGRYKYINGTSYVDTYYNQIITYRTCI